jgi:integrase
VKKLKLPKNPHKGLKTYCHKCKRDNPTCNHYDIHKYKVKIHIKGGENKKRTKILVATTYYDAVKEAINFENELISNNYYIAAEEEVGNDYSIFDAVVQYKRYLSGDYKYSHKVKKVTVEYQKECLRYCTYFLDSISTYKDVMKNRIVDVNQTDVARFYTWADGHYGVKAFNKCMGGLKAFFNFLIDVEEIQMKNQFGVYQSKPEERANVVTVNKEDFLKILDSIGKADPYVTLGGKGERKNMYRPYLVEGFKLFLLTGGRREDVIDLKWSDMVTTIDNIKFFKIANKKVNRIRKTEKQIKYVAKIPIGDDLMDLLTELGYESKRNSDEYILFPDRKQKVKTIMNDMSKAFTHYRKASGVKDGISLKSLRKTYITWVNSVMGKNTGLLTGHQGEQVLKDYYIDSDVLNEIEKAALKVKIFGT